MFLGTFRTVREEAEEGVGVHGSPSLSLFRTIFTTPVEGGRASTNHGGRSTLRLIVCRQKGLPTPQVQQLTDTWTRNISLLSGTP